MPKQKIVSMTEKYKTYYLIWDVLCEHDYILEGIPYNMQYKQQIAEKTFVIAHELYKSYHPYYVKFIKQHNNDNVNARITFERKTVKNLVIHEIEILGKHEPEFKQLKREFEQQKSKHLYI